MTHLNDSGFLEKIKESKNLVIKFVSSYCGPCKALTPIFNEVAGEFSEDTETATLEIDHNPEAIEYFKINSVPTIIFIKNGDIIKKLIGMQSKSKLEKEFQLFTQ